MTELQKQWRRQENLKAATVIILAVIAGSISSAIIIHAVDLLAVRCSL